MTEMAIVSQGVQNSRPAKVELSLLSIPYSLYVVFGYHLSKQMSSQKQSKQIYNLFEKIVSLSSLFIIVYKLGPVHQTFNEVSGIICNSHVTSISGRHNKPFSSHCELHFVKDFVCVCYGSVDLINKVVRK